MGMYDLFLCMELEGLYHINQQLSELLSCILLDDEVHEFAIELERKLIVFSCGFIGRDYLNCDISTN